MTPESLTLDSLGAVSSLAAAVVDSGGAAIPDSVLVEWASEDGGVAVVSAQGAVLARGPGNAVVRATTLDGALTGTARVAVTIPALAGVVDGGGGTVSAGGGAATLTVPGGAVTAAVAITARPAQPTGAELVAGTAWTIGPELAFGFPADLEIAYDEASIPAGQGEESLGLYRLDGSTWTEAGSIAVDVDRNKVVGTVAATGTYAIRAGRLGDPTGLWLVTETTTFDSCYDEAGLVEEVTVYAEKKGNVLTVERDGETVSGTLVGNVFGWDETYEYEGVNVHETYTITLNRTGLAATGKSRLVGSGPVSCEIRTTLEAELVSRERPSEAPDVHTVTLAFEENPIGLATRTWRPEVGDGTRLVARALDQGGAKVAVAEVILVYSEERVLTDRSEERRVGKECRSRWSPYH